MSGTPTTLRTTLEQIVRNETGVTDPQAQHVVERIFRILNGDKDDHET